MIYPIHMSTITRCIISPSSPQRALYPRDSFTALASREPDMSYPEVPILAHLPRLVFALLRRWV